MKKINVRETVIRLLLLCLGLIIAHLGVTLFLLADLGADPFNVLIQGLRLLVMKTGFSPTHGTVHMCVCFLIVIILLFADRSYVKLGTLVCMFYGGPIIDFFNFLLQGAWDHAGRARYKDHSSCSRLRYTCVRHVACDPFGGRHRSE